MSDEMIPEAFQNALERWARKVRLLHEKFNPHWLAAAYIAGLVAAGIRAEHGARWVQSAKGGFPKKLPYTVQFPCPFDHRSVDRRDDAKVQIIVEENARWSLDPDSPCPHCTGDRIAEWFLLCPRCEAGEDGERHPAGHPPFSAADVSPFAWIIRRFAQLGDIASARRWTERYDEAAADLRQMYAEWAEEEEEGGWGFWSPEEAEKDIAEEYAAAQAFLKANEMPPRAISAGVIAKPAKATMTTEQCASWLDECGVPSTASQDATWNAVKDRAGCPSKRTVEQAVNLRKSRATEA